MVEIGPILHLVNAIIGLVVLAVMIPAFKESRGTLAAGFYLLTIGILFIVINQVGYALYEWQDIEIVELASEVVLILGMISIVWGARKFAQAFKKE